MSTIVVFAPHPDDETLACGGTIVKKLREGDDVYVVIMTDGRHSHSHTFGIWTDPSPQELAGIRRKEAKRVAKILGLSPGHLLTLRIEDGALQDHIETTTHKVVHLLHRLKPDEAYYPDKNDLHRDHQATAIIVELALKASKRALKSYRYVIWTADTSIASTQHKNELMVVDISAFLPVKKAALQEYKSQLTPFSPKQSAPVLSAEFLQRFLTHEETYLYARQTQ